MHGQEVVQRIYVAIRDDNWRTVPLQIQHRDITQTDNGFSVVCALVSDDPLLRYRARLELLGSAAGRLHVDFSGVAESSFQRMRLGLCILHPQHLSGTPLTIGHDQTATEQRSLPTALEPWLVASNVRWLETGPADARVRLDLSGDQFEMEDQRNFGDSSFKTYSTPSALPRPVLVAMGETVQQTVTLMPCAAADTLLLLPTGPAGPAGPTGPHPPAMQRLHVGDDVRACARLGFLASEIPDQLHPAQHRLLALDLTTAWREGLAAAEQARAGDGAVTLISVPATHLTTATAAALAQHLPPDSEVLVHDAPDHSALARLRAVLPRETLLGHGTAGHFNDLHRGPRLISNAIGFAVNQLVHSDDTWSLLENTAALGPLVRSAKAINPRLRLGPLMLPAGDARHGTALSVTWLIAVLAHLLPELDAEDAVTLATHAELMAGPTASVLQAMAGMTGLRPLNSSPGRVVGLAIATPAGCRVLLANTDHQPAAVIVSGLRQGAEAVHLAGWAWARLDG